MRRTFFIILASIALIVVGAAIYFFFFAPKGPSLEVSDGSFFGSAGDAPNDSDTGEVDGPVKAGEEFSPQLIRITEGPVSAGVAVFTLPSQAATASGTPDIAGDTEIRYIDRASGNVYSYKFHVRTLTRISNRTLPGIQEAAWLSDGSVAFTRFLTNDGNFGEYVATYALPAAGEGGYFLDRGIGQISVSGTGTLFTLLPSTSGSVGTVANVDGSNPRTLFTSSLSNLIVHLSDGPFIAATKPSVGLDGYAFTISGSGSFNRILGPYRGLSVLPSPSGNLVLFSFVDNRAIKLSLLDRTAGTIISLPISTLAEKCVWELGGAGFYCGVPQGPTGNLPDDWHQGVVSFRDRLWRVDVTGRVATYVVNPSTEAGVDIDMIGLAIDGRNDVLTFKNKKDGSLWAYDL